jgi:hypothetical protein
MNAPILEVSGIVLFAGLCYLYLRVKRSTKASAIVPFDYPQASTALEHLRNWSAWITGLSTATIGAFGFLIEKMPELESLTDFQYWTGYSSFVFLGYSVFISTWLSGAIPSLALRLVTAPTQTQHNDIYEMSLFTNTPLRVERFAALQHRLFILGLLCFSIFLCTSLNGHRQPPKTNKAHHVS